MTVLTKPQPLIRVATPNERAARASLRAQITRLEKRLSLLTVDLWEAGRTPPPPHDRCIAEAHVPTFAELEATRDELVARIAAGERLLWRRLDEHACARHELEAMLADPASHRYKIIHCEQLGEPGCGAYRVVPRLGVLGMLFGWWCVKLSSGCP